MPDIQCLPRHVADLIAAGEVVERPASVAKELLENALDAGATAIVAEVQHGGLTYLRMTDNGCGIAPQQLPTAFLRHATSKLRTAGDLAAIGTLGFRGEALAAKGNERAAFILPKKPATLLKNLLPKEQGSVTIEFDERNAVFMLDSYRMVCRLIEGRYPNYNSVIPQNNPHKVTVDRQQLIGALRRVSIFSSQASSLIKLRMQENQIVISAQDIDFSTSAEETQVCQYAGAAMSIGFKSTFLIDILNNISADEVVIELADPSRAGVIVPVEQEENEDLLMLLMPMMLND
mgnify:CR=1 FL=1